MEDRSVCKDRKQMSGCLGMENWGCVKAKGYGICFGGDENILKLILVMVHTSVIYSQPVNCIL